MNLCARCGEDFSSVRAFDRHRVGRHAYDFAEGLDFERPVENGRRCLDELEMRDRGMARDQRGRWCITRDVEAVRSLRISQETPREAAA